MKPKPNGTREEKSKVRNQLLEASEPISEFNALQMLTKLRQISNHPVLADAESTIPSGKYQEVISYMETLHTAQHKALIFSSFVKHLELFEAWCKTHKIKYSKLTGATATHERKSQVEAFQNQEDVSFLFHLTQSWRGGTQPHQSLVCIAIRPLVESLCRSGRP